MTETQQQALAVDDPRVEVEDRPLLESGVLVSVRCAGCRLVLAYANDAPKAVRLAVNRAVFTPCCDLWITP